MKNLLTKKCVPCEGGTQPMSKEESQKYLSEVLGWEFFPPAGGKKIKKQFTFKNFKGAMAFVNKVADLAESEGHHPDIFISYNKVRLELWTHAIGGLSENDFIIAAKINNLS